MTKIRQKATKLLRNLSFHKPTHNISLVGAEVGGAANQNKVLILKQANKEELVEVKKALEQITVTLSMEQFLTKFFNMYHSDAEILTKLLGFETEYEDYKKKQEANGEEPWDYSDYLEERVSQFTIMKSMNDGSVENITKSAFNEVVAFQQQIEPALLSYQETKEKQMNEIEIAKAAQTKAEADLAIQIELVKSRDTQIAELQTQLDVFKAAQEKAEFDKFAEQLKGVVADEKLETVAKGLYKLHQIDADAAALSIEQLKASVGAVDVAKAAAIAAVADSELTKEQGHGSDVDVEKAKDAEAKAHRQEIMKKAVLGTK
jgi:hypothetical protein